MSNVLRNRQSGAQSEAASMCIRLLAGRLGMAALRHDRKMQYWPIWVLLSGRQRRSATRDDAAMTIPVARCNLKALLRALSIRVGLAYSFQDTATSVHTSPNESTATSAHGLIEALNTASKCHHRL